MPIEGGRGGAGQDAQDELAAMQVRTDLAPDPAEHLRLDPEQDDVGAVHGLDVRGDRPDAVFALEVLATLLARGGWRPPVTGSTSCPRSMPAIIASAITPEPTVAMVDLAKGDIARSIAAGCRVTDAGDRPRDATTDSTAYGSRRARSRSGRTGRSS